MVLMDNFMYFFLNKNQNNDTCTTCTVLRYCVMLWRNVFPYNYIFFFKLTNCQLTVNCAKITEMPDKLETQPYGIITMAMTVLGIIVNLSSIILLCKRKRNSMFHSLLKVI